MSQSDGYSKCICKNCGGHIEFPSEGAGTTVPCPHCNWSTVLIAAADPVAAAPKGGGTAALKKIFLAIFIAAIVVAADVGGVYWYHSKHDPGLPPPPTVPEQPVPTKPAAPVEVVPAVPPDPWHGLMTTGPIKLESAPGSHLVYAVGKLRNDSDHQRFGVKVELDVFNADKEKIGTATDYAASIDPGKEWSFRALVTDRAAKTAQLTAVKEN